MKRHRRNLAKVVTVALLVSGWTMGMAGPRSAAAADPVVGMGKKLVRGIANVATGWVELPKAIVEKSVEEDPFTGVVLGTLEGSAKTIMRTGAGAYEAGTFFIPLPGNYEPVTQPETMLNDFQ